MEKYHEGLKRGMVGGTPGEKCEHCKLTYGKEGHDACLGTLIGVMNACCGHGNDEDAYVQFLDGESVYGKDAVTIQRILKKQQEGNSMIGLREYNKRIMEEIKEEREREKHTGVACDECGEELLYSDNSLLMSYPPQRNVRCPKCDKRFHITVNR